jgi:lipopolysaccharide transport system ATP-binding protein
MGNIIQVENLSKKYIIGHQQLRGKKTFRDIIYQNFATIGSKFIHPFSKNISSYSPFEEFWALKDINFEVEQGDRIGIIGRNGAGKSTLLKVLSRITEPTTGKIIIKGRVASLLEVGTGFNGELTGRENIFLNGAILGMHRTEIRQKFDEIVDFSGVEKFLDTPVKRYSSGMYVRLAFSVAAHLEPEILLVDEVLAVGDAEFQRKCLGKMKDISQKGGRTVIFVSHNMAAIRSLCSKCILIERGKIVEIGERNIIIDNYLNQQIGGKIINYETSLFIVKNVEIISNDGNICKTFGDIEIKVLIIAKKRIDDFGIYVGILNKNGDRVLGIDYRDFKRAPIIKVTETFVVGFKFKRLPLLPGTYYVDIHLKDMNNNIIEIIEKIASFEIINTPIYGNRILDDWFGNIAVDAEPFFSFNFKV